jgi:dolichyl-phosphate-mannose--protein O-mannosyl transferase
LSASARATAALDETTSRFGPLAAILAVGLLLRLLFVGAQGFHSDVDTFVAWTLALRDNPPWLFYAKTGFADYPPGYFVVLWVLAKLYALIPGSANDGAHGYAILHAMVKLPAIAMDLVNAGVVYAIVRRYASQSVALLAAALLALNPAAIYVSAYWGQVDSVSWGFVLIALWCILRAGDDPAATTKWVTRAWLVFAFSVLIKPQASTIGLLFLAYPFATTDPAVRARRLKATGLGVLSAVLLAGAVAAVFHPAPDVFGWLYGRYAFGSGVYAYNSVNAFNLYAMRQPFWQPDATPLSVFGLSIGSLWGWGIALVAAATALIVGRYVQRKDDRALLEGAMLCALAFFVLATRMHERYVYGAFLLSMPLVAFGRTGLWSSLVLTVTMYLNLAYSLAYLKVMDAHTPGVNTADLWPGISHPAAIANVLLFFVLGYLYLGGVAESPVRDALRQAQGDKVAPAARARAWFDPREGIVAMTRLDWLLAGGFTLVSFVICVLWVQFPNEKYFDEIYYARAGEEYLKNLNVSGWGPFEFTHPPLTKLLITLSMLMFGGLHGAGDTGLGWRFLNVVVGALMVGLIYTFAKRLTSSTLFASLAAGMLALDGFHFAQSRIATPEITVAFLSLLTLYAFYRLWIGTQVARRAPPFRAQGATLAFGATMAIGAVAAIGAWFLAPHLGPIKMGTDWVIAAQTVLAAWTLVLFWLVARVVVVPRFTDAADVSYADGTRVLDDGRSRAAATPEGEALALGGSSRKPLFSAQDDGLKRTLDREGTLTYATPVATATYRADATAGVDGTTALRARDARMWWFVLPLAGALLVDAKWNGLFDFGVIWFIAAAVAVQRWIRRPALFGNPYGAPLDVVAASMIVAGGIVYILSYIPYFLQGHGFVDVVAMQHDMYRYHSTLVATHPYASQWWQWPLMDKPILYWAKYTHTAAAGQADCCVATIRALPNPFVWLFGLLSVPYVAWLAWKERNKGYALLIVAYLFQWLPWIGSPRLAFEYHFFPNLAIIVLANAIVLQRVWNYARERDVPYARYAVIAYAAVVLAGFIYFYPTVSGAPISWDSWGQHMWNPHWI